MGKFDQAHSPGDVMRRLHELERIVAELTAGRRLENASVGAGGVRVHGGGGVRVHEGGDVEVHDGGNVQVTGGGDVEVVGGNVRAVDSEGTVMLDVGGDLLGMARPWIPLRINQNVDRGQFWQDVTFSDFTNVADACGFFQHGHIVVLVNILVDSGTTAEFRFLIRHRQDEEFTTPTVTVTGDGTHRQFGRTIAVDPTFNLVVEESGNCAILQGRRVSGSGQVRANLGMAYGTGLDGNPYPILNEGDTADGTTPPDGSVPPGGGGGGTGMIDHGELEGLADDDHTQYLNQIRGDLRYYTQSEVDSALSGKSDTGHLHDGRYYTEVEADNLLDDKADVGHVHGNIASGREPGNTDADAKKIIAHGLGVKPSAVFAIAEAGDASLTYCVVDYVNTDTTNIVITCRDVRDGALLANNATTVHWVAIV